MDGSVNSAGTALRKIAVRELCAFTAKTGDLDLRFTPAPTAEEGIAGHHAVRARRGTGYQSEVTLQGAYESLWIRGRADGLQPNPLLLEEIKTHRGPIERVPENHRSLHWAQLKCYGAQLCQDRDLETLDLRLVYFNVDTDRETHFTETLTREALRQFRDRHAQTYLDWETAEASHRTLRDVALSTVPFPHAGFHSGQRQLAEAVYRSIVRAQPLMAQAPTGIGKSIGTLFPALKAMAQGHLDKVFYLTAKTSGRQAALSALQSLKNPQGEIIPLRTLELVARDKACIHKDKACHGESCPLARGFYDRLPAARAAAVKQHQLGHDGVRVIAAEHGVCPYYLGQELVRWADVVIGDVNYYFDTSALLMSLTTVNEWRVAVLVDEAHNLVERGRAMYSAALDEEGIPTVPARVHRGSSRALKRLKSVWRALSNTVESDYTALEMAPAAVVDALKEVIASIGRHFLDTPAAATGELQRFYFDALALMERIETLGPHSLCDLQRIQQAGRAAVSTLTIRNVVPAPFLAPRLAAARCAILFSATLSPPHYVQQLSGLPESTPWLDVPSPFAAGQLAVQIDRKLSTRYQHRERSLQPLVERIARQFEENPGNYLAFFSSYQYLQQVAVLMQTCHPALPVRLQTRRMTETDQLAFLEGFTDESQVIGMAVLGGAFAEGIDLPGRRLIGVFIATLGLPQMNPVNEAVKRRLELLMGEGQGYDFAYLFPGLQKVVQAAGRVIRTTEDRGYVWLLDDRYATKSVRALLPLWWAIP
ncbi:MAG: ATP-dependent DNA helicase [Pseudomonadota bacterium]